MATLMLNRELSDANSGLLTLITGPSQAKRARNCHCGRTQENCQTLPLWPYTGELSDSTTVAVHKRRLSDYHCGRTLQNSHGGFTLSQKFATFQKLHIFATFGNNKRTTKRSVESSV